MSAAAHTEPTPRRAYVRPSVYDRLSPVARTVLAACEALADSNGLIAHERIDDYTSPDLTWEQVGAALSELVMRRVFRVEYEFGSVSLEIRRFQDEVFTRRRRVA